MIGRRRRGTSLLEMMAVMTFGVILLGLGARTIVAVLRLDRIGRDRLADDVSLGLLARDFRADVHSARVARPGGKDGATLDLEVEPDHLYHYAIEAGELVRTERLGDRSGGRRAYALRGRKPPTFEVEGDAAATLVRLRVASRDGSITRGDAKGFEIEAAIGRDARLSRPRRDADATAK